MGFDDVLRRPRRRNQVQVGRTLDTTLLMKVLRLFQEYENIHIVHFPALYEARYDEIFDAAAMGFDDGLIGFFNETNMVDIKDLYNDPIAILKPEHRSRDKEQVKTKEDIKNECLVFILNHLRGRNPLFNPNNLELWGNFAHLLSKQDQLIIPTSPFETTYIFNRRKFNCQVREIQLALRNFPDGIKLNEINNIVKINKRLLQAPSISDAVIEYPELFFWTEPDEFEGEPIIFDGLTNTHQDLTGLSIQGSLANCIIYRLIMSGLYQKTLLLIKRTADKGLKLAVWCSAIEQNFKPEIEQSYENNLLDIGSDIVFLSLASQKLVTIKSGSEYKNDLRVFLPSEFIDFKNLLSMIKRDNDRFADPIPKDKLDSLSKTLYRKAYRYPVRLSYETECMSTSSTSSQSS